MPILPSGGARFIEQGGGSAPAISTVPLCKDGSGAWVYGTAQPATGLLADWSGSGTYEILDTSVPGVIVTDGTDLIIQAGPGTPAAIIAFDGTDLYVTTDLTQQVAAQIYIAANDGALIIVPTADLTQLVAHRVGPTNILIHP